VNLAKVFIKTLGIYPPGTGVRLRNGSLAVVIQRGAAGHQPVVASLTTHNGLRLASPIRRSGDADAHTIVEVVNLWQLGMSVSMEALWGADAHRLTPRHAAAAANHRAGRAGTTYAPAS